jgi:hypothetical protein
MQRDAIAFAVEHDGTKAMRANRVDWLDDRTAVRHYVFYGIANAAVDVEIKKNAPSGDLVLVLHEATPVALLVLEIAKTYLFDANGQNGPIEGRRPIQIYDRNVKPDGSIVRAIEIAHGAFVLLL